MHESDIVIWARRIPPREWLTENDDDKNGNDTRDDTRTRIHEKSRIERSRIDFARERNRKVERDMGKIEKGKKKKRVASFSLEQNMAYVTSRGTIRPTDRVQAAGTSIRRYSC